MKRTLREILCTDINHSKTANMLQKNLSWHNIICSWCKSMRTAEHVEGHKMQKQISLSV